MDQPTVQSPSFNLWHEPWITVEKEDGELVDLSLAALLTDAHKLRTMFDPSPLVVVGVHRLLVAILQAIYAPQRDNDLARVWRAGQFDVQRIEAFGAEYAGRFDLFSESAPFLQTADVPLVADKSAKPVGYLFPDLPAGTAVTHYTHLYDAGQNLCTACAAKGLLTIPAFASSGGAGIKPSINGVPPIYLLPGGSNYFASLAASLTTPTCQPTIAAHDADLAWWLREPVVEKKGIVDRVGYLHSLTFPARRVRLYPTPLHMACTRCGVQTTWGVQTMLYEMGESRPNDAALWQDPFAAYTFPSAKAGSSTGPRPVRPKEGQAYWREFSTLFLERAADQKEAGDHRPRVLDQLDKLSEANVLPFGDAPIPFRLIGVRTDGKMKYFEWQEEGFLVPPRLLHDPDAEFVIRRAIDLAEAVAGDLAFVFRAHFGGDRRDGERYQRVKNDMVTAFWQGLAVPFRAFVMDLGASSKAADASQRWTRSVAQHGKVVFETAAAGIGSDGAALRHQVEALNHLGAKIYNTIDSKTVQEKE